MTLSLDKWGESLWKSHVARTSGGWECCLGQAHSAGLQGVSEPREWLVPSRESVSSVRLED